MIARLTQEFEAKREAVVKELFKRLNGRLTDEDRKDIEGAFRLLQNRFLHGPISALTEDTHTDAGRGRAHAAGCAAEAVPLQE